MALSLNLLPCQHKSSETFLGTMTDRVTFLPCSCALLSNVLTNAPCPTLERLSLVLNQTISATH